MIPIEMASAPFEIKGTGMLAIMGFKVFTAAAPPMADASAPITVTPTWTVARNLSGSA